MEDYEFDGLEFSFEDSDQTPVEEETTDVNDDSTATDESLVDNKDIIEEDQQDPSNEDAEDDSSEEVGEEDAQDEGGNEGSSSDLYSSLAEFVYEQGLLPSLSADKLKDIKDVDTFTKALREEQVIQSKLLLEEHLNSLDLESIKNAKSIINDISSVTEQDLANDIEMSKNIIREDFKNQGLNDNQINRIINKLVDLGDEDVVNEALASRDSLIEIQKNKIEEQKLNYERQKAEDIRRQEELQVKIKSSVYDTPSILEGYQPTPALRDTVYKTMTTPVATDSEGNQLNQFMKDRSDDPIGFETRLYYAYVLTDGFKSIKNLGSSAKSSAVKDLEKTLKNFKVKQDSTPSYVKDKESYYGDNFDILFN